MSFLDARWRLGLKVVTLGCAVLLAVLLFVLTKEVFLGLPPAKAPGRATGELYKLFIERPAALNGQGFVSWRLIKEPGAKLNTAFPTKLVLSTSPAGVLRQTTYEAKDFMPHAESQMAVSVPYAIKGPVRLDYELSFSVCVLKDGRVESCQLKHEKGAFPLMP